MWDDYHGFLIATVVFTRLLLDEIYYLIQLPVDWLICDAMFVCLLDESLLGFSYSDLTWETGGFELASTITLVLQANRLTKCAIHNLPSLLSNKSLVFVKEKTDRKKKKERKKKIWTKYQPNWTLLTLGITLPQ